MRKIVVTGVEVAIMGFIEVVIMWFGLDGHRYTGGRYGVWFGW
jgi:hypothetical protein